MLCMRYIIKEDGLPYKPRGSQKRLPSETSSRQHL